MPHLQHGSVSGASSKCSLSTLDQIISLDGNLLSLQSGSESSSRLIGIGSSSSIRRIDQMHQGTITTKGCAVQKGSEYVLLD